MATHDDEEHLLHSVALQNASSILLARRRAEEELVHAKEALEARTEELARSLSMMHATLESTTDGIVATDEGGTVTCCNENFVAMWGVPRAVVDAGKHRRLLEVMARHFADPRAFLDGVEAVQAQAPPESFDLLALADGRVFERFSRIQRVDGRNVGRVWSFRDVTERAR
ncbi:MAG TPA: PAS-domain containing protein, partial [Longimicrobiaceae bacterium]|nr:PAS-domain containing protein [Longimicrobiaceae bacterium]